MQPFIVLSASFFFATFFYAQLLSYCNLLRFFKSSPFCQQPNLACSICFSGNIWTKPDLSCGLPKNLGSSSFFWLFGTSCGFLVRICHILGLHSSLVGCSCTNVLRQAGPSRMNFCKTRETNKIQMQSGTTPWWNKYVFLFSPCRLWRKWRVGWGI